MASSPHRNSEPNRLVLEGVSVAYGAVRALDEVSFEVEPGERVAVIGASGAGKSTLFRALTRSAPLQKGRIEIGERDLYSLPRRELREARQRIGVVHQAYNLVPQLPAGVNVALGVLGGMGAAGTLRALLLGPDEKLSARVSESMGRLGLDGMAATRTADLSGGQQQRVAVARLLVQRPGLVLADEPFAAVDPVTTEHVMDALLDLNREGSTLLLNLHDVQIARRFPRLVALRGGSVVYDGPPERLDDEKLNHIYAGDPYGAPTGDETGQGAKYRRKDPVRSLRGQDGVSSH